MDQPVSRPVPESRCPFCNHRLACVSNNNPEGVPEHPESDALNVVICIGCGAVLGVGREWKPRPLTDDELRDMLRDPALLLQLARMKRAVDTRNALRARRN